MYQRFGLTLMVTHACNLRCTYCYTGRKWRRSMSPEVGCAAIDRAAVSLVPQGVLELGFFGGEPLMESDLVCQLIARAREQTARRDLGLSLSLTTNGTVADPLAWNLMMLDDLDLSISCDGLPEIHDRYRLNVLGHGTSKRVLDTIRRLVAAGREFRVVMVVQPDTVEALPQGIAYLRELGVRRVQPSLNLWMRWSAADITRLEHAVQACALAWRTWLPEMSISWFDEKAGALAGIRSAPSARCAFGDGEIAVAPSGRLYPCERLIGEDADDNPMVLSGHALDGTHFCNQAHARERTHAACDVCAMSSDCNTVCRCSNYVRTGDIATPDRLLCALNQTCLTQTARVLNEPVQVSVMDS